MSNPAASQQPVSWLTCEARKLAALCRKNGIRCRIIRSKRHDTFVHVYRESVGFSDLWKTTLEDMRSQSIDANYVIVNNEC